MSQRKVKELLKNMKMQKRAREKVKEQIRVVEQQRLQIEIEKEAEVAKAVEEQKVHLTYFSLLFL